MRRPGIADDFMPGAAIQAMRDEERNRVTYIRPLGMHILQDAEAIEAYHRDVEAQHRWARRWRAFGVWLAFVACCALAWYGILWLAYRATEGR